MSEQSMPGTENPEPEIGTPPGGPEVPQPDPDQPGAPEPPD
jgi:hypothetical protein